MRAAMRGAEGAKEMRGRCASSFQGFTVRDSPFLIEWPKFFIDADHAVASATRSEATTPITTLQNSIGVLCVRVLTALRGL